jgi:hypothetical protein
MQDGVNANSNQSEPNYGNTKRKKRGKYAPASGVYTYDKEMLATEVIRVFNR